MEKILQKKIILVRVKNINSFACNYMERIGKKVKRLSSGMRSLIDFGNDEKWKIVLSLKAGLLLAEME